LAAFHNSRLVSSEKSEENSVLPVDSSRALALKLAADLARQVGMVRTWPNLQTIRLAIESEAEQSEVSLNQAAALIAMAAHEWTAHPRLRCLSAWEEREIARVNTIDRFWFEDARWRSKSAYAAFLNRLNEAEASA
jgi:hypothetical protein